MALTQSPSIVRNGLIFYYDLSNTQKSWKGKPSTNLIVYSEEFDRSSNWIYVDCSVTKTTSVTAPDNSKNAYAFYGNSNNNYHTVYQNYSYVSGVTYTQSIYVKSARYTSAYMQFAPAAFGSWIGVTFNLITGTCNSPGTITNVGNGWFRCSVTATATANASSAAVYFYASNVQYVGTGSANDPDIYIFGGQLEESSFPTPYIKTTASQASRSNTQAILDLTNNNTVTASSLTYNSDNTFSFNGSSNYISISNSSILRPSTELTIEYLIKGVTPASWNPILGYGNGDYTNGNYLVWVESGGGLHALCRVNNTEYRCTPANYISNSGYAHVAYTMKTGDAIRPYFNGTASATTTSLPSGTFTYNATSLPYQICGSGGSWFNGTVSSVRLYNRALTATEVLQNFNAQRDRYGI